jgi:hypothetical protein
MLGEHALVFFDNKRKRSGEPKKYIFSKKMIVLVLTIAALTRASLVEKCELQIEKKKIYDPSAV